jgi:hypothetical protein
MRARAAVTLPIHGSGRVRRASSWRPPAPKLVAHRARLAEGQQGGVDAVLERGPVADQVQPEPCPFSFGPHPWGGQPDLGDQVAAGQLGQHPGVDPVGLAGQRGQAFDLLGVGDGDLPAGQLQLVMDEAGTVHRLDRRPHRLPVSGGLAGQPAQPVGIRRRGGDPDRAALRIKQTHVQPVA